jgi:FHA domain
VSLAFTADETLLGLKIGFLVLLYLFIWLVVRSATRQVVAAPQESMVISARDAATLRAQHTAPSVRLVVRASPVLPVGTQVEISGPTRVGRGAECELILDGDTTVSSRHARLDSRSDGLWVEDSGSTNGTFVNDAPVTAARLLHPGDVVRFGQTDLVVDG